jgi:hypothetical protein
MGGEYAMLMCLAALGYVIADVAADGLTVEFAQREPIETRGGTQTMIYLVRTIGGCMSTALVGFCMNGKEYSGTFEWSLSFNEICLVLAFPAAIMVPISWFLVNEDRVTDDKRVAATGGVLDGEGGSGEPRSFREYMKQSFDLLSSKAFFYVVCYNFDEKKSCGEHLDDRGRVREERVGGGDQPHRADSHYVFLSGVRPGSLPGEAALPELLLA